MLVWLFVFGGGFLMFFGKSGQFFSPDLIIATSVFVFSLVIFFSSSISVFGQSELYEERKSADETAHALLNSLLLSPGDPLNWENGVLSDVNAFGLVHEPNVIDSNKVFALVNHLNSDLNYNSTRQILGAGIFDLKLNIRNSNGGLVDINGVQLSGGRIASDALLQFSYKRMALFNGSFVIAEVVISFD